MRTRTALQSSRAPMGRLAARGLVMAILIWHWPPAAAAPLRVEPPETDELFANPGMGWQTFHRFADEDPNLQGLPSASAYFRFYWRELEPREGHIDFAKFDELLAHARRAGQKLAFRVMCTGSGQYNDVPAWLKDQGCRGVEFNYEGRKHWVPEFTDPQFQKAHLRLVRELGRRYDGHPDLDLLDIGSVGLWGEWHMSGTEALGTGQPVPLPSMAERLAIIAAWREAFPKTRQVILIGSEEGMRRAVAEGYGWRADCLGDMGGFSKNWNHMEHFYMQQLARTGAQEAWQRAPVAFESCWDMRKWQQAGWDIPYIFDYALRCHASYLNNKSAPIPEGTRADLERFLRRLGYRLVVRAVEHEPTVPAGAEAAVTVEWENVGVAPPYRDYRVALRLSPEGDPTAGPVVRVTDASIRGWLPGKRRTALSIPIPALARAGGYTLALAVVDPATQTPAVRLALGGREPDGWYPVSHVAVEPRAGDEAFLPLLSPEALAHWRQCGPGRFTVTNGVATGEGGMGLWWFAQRSFTNFVLRGEFLQEQDIADSGVFLRFPDPGNDPWAAVHQGHEVEIGDPQPKDPTWRTGSIYPFQASSKANTKPPGQWNEYEITAVGHRYLVKINGEPVTDWTDPKQRTTHGYVGLQNYNDEKTVRHRRLCIKPLP